MDRSWLSPGRMTLLLLPPRLQIFSAGWAWTCVKSGWWERTTCSAGATRSWRNMWETSPPRRWTNGRGRLSERKRGRVFGPQGAEAGFPVVVEIPVAWGEMDAYGHVNNIVFFRYFETARIAYFQETAVTPGRWDQEKVGRILAQTSCRFRVPLVYPDTVHVGARISQLGSDRFIMRYRVVSEALEKVVADCEALVVAFDYANNCKT